MAERYRTKRASAVDVSHLGSSLCVTPAVRGPAAGPALAPVRAQRGGVSIPGEGGHAEVIHSLHRWSFGSAAAPSGCPKTESLREAPSDRPRYPEDRRD